MPPPAARELRQAAAFCETARNAALKKSKAATEKVMPTNMETFPSTSLPNISKRLLSNKQVLMAFIAIFCCFSDVVFVPQIAAERAVRVEFPGGASPEAFTPARWSRCPISCLSSTVS